MKRFVLFSVIYLLVLTGTATAQNESGVVEMDALTLLNEVKYGADFDHFDYVEPDAPKGGTVRLATVGTGFDSLNPFILKGVKASGLGSTYDSLLKRSLDEPSSAYGLLAESIRVAEDSAWVEFDLREGARWHDGTPLTVDDVIFSFETLMAEGHPFYQSYFASVANVEAVDERTVRFTFQGDLNRELAFIVGDDLPIIPKHYWEGRDFAATTLEPPLGSGPYRIANVDPGRSITYERVPDYWGADLPVNVGQHNFATIAYDYYRDNTVAIEALKAYEYDFRAENSSQEWATSYNLPAVESGLMLKELVPDANGRGMQAFWFNTRRSKFADPKVREALGYAFDFEWSNKTLFYGQYTRTDSFFENSELASSGVPEGQELATLEPYRDSLPDDVFTTAFSLPVSDASGNLRANLRTARQLLQEAGWEIQNGQLTNTASGEVMRITFLLDSPTFERIVSPVIQNLERLGVQATLRTVDAAQYQNLVQNFDYDVVIETLAQSLSPGNEQREFFGSEAATTPGTRNYAGIQNPTVDALIETVISAPDRDTLVTATRALDRVLLSGHYVIPQWYLPATRIVYWNKFGQPEVAPDYALGFPDTWWLDESKRSELEAAR